MSEVSKRKRIAYSMRLETERASMQLGVPLIDCPALIARAMKALFPVLAGQVAQHSPHSSAITDFTLRFIRNKLKDLGYGKDRSIEEVAVVISDKFLARRGPKTHKNVVNHSSNFIVARRINYILKNYLAYIKYKGSYKIVATATSYSGRDATRSYFPNLYRSGLEIKFFYNCIPFLRMIEKRKYYLYDRLFLGAISDGRGHYHCRVLTPKFFTAYFVMHENPYDLLTVEPRPDPRRQVP